MMQNSQTFGVCVTCQRYTALTKHHLIPKKRHKKIKQTLSSIRDEVIHICRMCHDGIHDFYDERTLAKEYNTLEKLCADETLHNYFIWVSKCKKGLK